MVAGTPPIGAKKVRSARIGDSPSGVCCCQLYESSSDLVTYLLQCRSPKLDALSVLAG